MSREPTPTDPKREQEVGRVAVWLDPEDARWLAHHLAQEDGTPDEQERIGRLRFRLLAALHKAGFPNDRVTGD